jgi:hypothetical protein
MKPASEIIKLCGGPKTVADWLGLERTAVQRWTYPEGKGTGEQIPMKHWARLIEEAGRRGVVVTLQDLMPADIAVIAARESRAPQSEAA